MWTVPRAWRGETAVILGGGPSLQDQLGISLHTRLFKPRVIAVNNSWEIAPYADVLYFCDSKWWSRMRPKDPALSSYQTNGEAVLAHFGGLAVTISEIEHPRVKRLRNTGQRGLETRADGLRHNTNSGAQAINLAYHFGAQRILLLGFDMRVNGERTHWHAGHGREAAYVAHMTAKVFAPAFQSLVAPLAAAGVEVINCTPGSALGCWPKRSFNDVVDDEERAKCVAA